MSTAHRADDRGDRGPWPHWHDEAELLGMQVRVWFFDPDAAQSSPDPVLRLLPLLAGLGVTPQAPAGERRLYEVGALQAQPELVLSHGNGLICLGNKPPEGRLHAPGQWRSQLPAGAALQAVATAMAVAGQTQLPTLALWRGPNAVFQCDPGPQVLECLATSIGAACHYWGEPARVGTAQLAGFCEPRLRAAIGRDRGTVPASVPAA